jgi:hypothetical protein
MLDAPFAFDAARGSVLLTTPKGEYGIMVASSASWARCEVIRARDERDRVQGFWSPYYAEALPAPTLEVAFDAALPLRIVSVLAPGSPVSARLAEHTPALERWEFVRGSDRTILELRPPARHSPPS